MNDIKYAVGTFDFFYDAFTTRLGRRFEDVTVLEIGPGDSVALGVLAKLRGARRSFLIDSGDFATKDVGFYSELIGKKLPHESFDEMLIRFEIDYLTSGLDSIKKIADKSVDLIVSNAVLEHIAPDVLRLYVAEFTRVLGADGVMVHRVDYRDHLTGKKFHKSLPSFLSNSEFYLNSFLYLNKLSEDDFVKMFLKNGFEIQVIDSKKLIHDGRVFSFKRSSSKNLTNDVGSSCLVCVSIQTR